MAATPPDHALEEKLRSWWATRQGLCGSSQASDAAGILEKTGWQRSVGGANPYLALFARGGIRRGDADADAAKIRIYELPSARGCTYVIPERHYALGLKVSQPFAVDTELKLADKLGISEAELGTLCEAVRASLDKPLEVRPLRAVLGGAVRDLGEEGTKRGVTSTLPLALRILQSRGQIRRVPVSGRFDEQRYAYVAWEPAPEYPGGLDEAFQELAELYWRWIGPASLGNFCWFSGLGVGAARQAVAKLPLRPIRDGSALLILEDDLPPFNAHEPAEQPDFRLISGLDSLFLLRREILELFHPSDRHRTMAGEKKTITVLGSPDLLNNAIVECGRVVGLWEFDPEEGKIVWKSFIPPSEALRQAVATTEEYIRSDLGDARSFSLDSPKSRRPKLELLRAMPET